MANSLAYGSEEEKPKVVKPKAKARSKVPTIPSPKVPQAAKAPVGSPEGPFEGPISAPESVRIKPDEMVRDFEKKRDEAIKAGQSAADKVAQTSAPTKKARAIPAAAPKAKKGKEAPPAEAVKPAKIASGQVVGEAGSSGQPDVALEQRSVSPARQVIPIKIKRKAARDSRVRPAKSYDELYKDSEYTALAFQDLSNPNTDLGQANQRAKDAREILGDIKSLQDIDPTVQQVVEDKIKQIVNDKYEDSPESRQMAQSLVDRVGSDGSIDNSNLEELDWQMVPSSVKTKLGNLGISLATISIPASKGTFLEEGLKNKYKDNRQAIKSMSHEAPGLPIPPVNPNDFKRPSGGLPKPAAQKTGLAGAGASVGTVAKAGSAQFYLRHPLDAGGLRVARRGAAGKLAGKPQRMGSGHWQPQLAYGPTPEAPLGEMGEEGEWPEEAEGGLEEGPPAGAGLEGGRPGPLPTGHGQPTPPPSGGPKAGGMVQPESTPYDMPPGEDIPDENLPEDLRKERQLYRDKQSAATLAMLPMMLGTGQLDDAGQLEGIKDPETGGNLDLGGSLSDVTGQRDTNAAFNASDKEIGDMENDEARLLARKKKKGEPEEDEEKKKNAMNARKAKLAAGLRKHIKNHKETKWGILFGIAAFEDLISVLDVFVAGILYLIISPIIFCCWLYKHFAFLGKEGEADKAWQYGSWITEQIPYINYLPASLGYIFKMFVGSRARMTQAQKQLKRLEKKMSKRQAKRRVKKLQQAGAA